MELEVEWKVARAGEVALSEGFQGGEVRRHDVSPQAGVTMRDCPPEPANQWADTVERDHRVLRLRLVVLRKEKQLPQENLSEELGREAVDRMSGVLCR